MRDCATAEAYQELANGIVLQAVADYRNALVGRSYGGKSSEELVEECECFFRSKYFRMLTRVSGEYLIEKIRKEVEDEHHPDSTDP